MKKIAIIGASYLQEPLIRKAKDLGIETHVFAWKVGDIGEKIADFFYPISIVEKEKILAECTRIGIDGICSIASDLAVVTVNYVAEKMGLTGNSIESAKLSTNKHNMRMAFERNHDPSPKSYLVRTIGDADCIDVSFPLIVKPLDRSGSRGIFKVQDYSQLSKAISAAKEYGFIKEALLEEFVSGKEYSIECITYKGTHRFLAMTLKYTTGAPHFIETGHLEPAPVSEGTIERVKEVIFHALDSLKIKNGASHSEIKIDSAGNVKIIEIGSRMGGDFIGSSLVFYSTGIDYVKAVIQVALGEEPDLEPVHSGGKIAAIHYICDESDIMKYDKLLKENRELIVAADVPKYISGEVSDSSSRFGYFIMTSDKMEIIDQYMPKRCD